MSVLDYRSGIDERADKPRAEVGNWLAWAIYLGMSWTWCIGMFLPVLIIRDFGGWAWVVFAIPNVVGAAAMGWTIDGERSAKIVSEHRAAIQTFSFVTATFQIFFATWMFAVSRFPGGSAWVMVILALLLFLLGRKRAAISILFAGSLFLISLGCIIQVDGWPYPIWQDHFPKPLLALAPVCVFGFALCPYLDPTFHLARQRAKPQAARTAFGVGFGVFFLAMIYFTLVYAGIVIHWMEENPFARGILVVIGVYWTCQLAFTVGLHWQGTGWLGVLVTIVLGVALGYASRLIHYGTIHPGELIYRLFMAFYGLIFPAYVWLCMIPNWRHPAKPSRRPLAVFAGGVALAAPFYWMGFIEQRMYWLLPGLAVVLLARLFLRSQRTVPPSPGTA